MSPRWSTTMPETIWRTARKRWECAGDGAAEPRHADDCPRTIEPGDLCIEYVGEAPAYQSGTRHTIACGARFYALSQDSPHPMEIDLPSETRSAT